MVNIREAYLVEREAQVLSCERRYTNDAPHATRYILILGAKIARFNTRRQEDRGRDKLASHLKTGSFVALCSARNAVSIVSYE
jgi:hypothetical protein